MGKLGVVEPSVGRTPDISGSKENEVSDPEDGSTVPLSSPMGVMVQFTVADGSVSIDTVIGG